MVLQSRKPSRTCQLEFRSNHRIVEELRMIRIQRSVTLFQLQGKSGDAVWFYRFLVIFAYRTRFQQSL